MARIRLSAETGRLTCGEDSKRVRLQRVTGEDRDRIPEDDMGRRLSATQRVIVHRRQVVMDQRVRMDHLERGRRG